MDFKSKPQSLSIEKTSQRLFSFTLLNFIVIILAVVFVSLTNYLSRQADEESRNLLLKMNRLIVLLNNQSSPEDGDTPTSEVMETSREIYNDFYNIPFFMRDGLTFSLPSYESKSDRQEYYDEIVFFIRTLRSRQSQYRTFSLSAIAILLVLSALFSTFNMWEHVRWRRYNRMFMNDIKNGLADLDHILRYQNREKDYVTPIRESAHFFSHISEINRTIEYNRRIRELSVFGNLDEIIKYIYSLLSIRMNCDRVSLAFIDEIENNVIAETSYSPYTNYYLEPGYSQSLDESSLGQVAASGTYRIISDLEKYASQKDSITTEKLLRKGIRSNLTVPMFFQEKCIGFVFVSSREYDSYNDEQADYASWIIDLLKQKLYIEYILQNVIADTSRSFVTLMERKDNETAQHISRMSQYSFIIAGKYSEKYETLSPKFLREILWYAPLHDIGKVGIPDRILLKEGPLTDDEMDLMKEHVIIGEKVIDEINRRMSRSFSIPALNTAVEIISGHHEKYDGSGYPRGLKGEEIPLAGRICALADVFDALTTKRPYKKAFTLEKALSIMEDSMSVQFDPRLYECFRESLEEIRAVYIRYGEF